MAPIKLDKKLKETLEQRRLQPSSKAWSQLANRLDSEENSKNKVLYWWFGIAASVALIIAISSPFFNKDIETSQPIIVDSKTQTNTQKNKLENNKLPQEVTIVKQVKETSIVSKTAALKIRKKMPEKEVIIIRTSRSNTKESVADTDQIAPIDSDAIKTSKQNTITFEDIKIQDVVAEIQKMKDAPSGVTDKEIDSLLKIAHEEIITQRIYKETTKTVDAELLLQDVEADLEQSFRIKVFEALKTNYGKVKTAVAERNN